MDQPEHQTYTCPVCSQPEDHPHTKDCSESLRLGCAFVLNPTTSYIHSAPRIGDLNAGPLYYVENPNLNIACVRGWVHLMSGTPLYFDNLEDAKRAACFMGIDRIDEVGPYEAVDDPFAGTKSPMERSVRVVRTIAAPEPDQSEAAIRYRKFVEEHNDAKGAIAADAQRAKRTTPPPA